MRVGGKGLIKRHRERRSQRLCNRIPGSNVPVLSRKPKEGQNLGVAFKEARLPGLPVTTV